MAKRTKTELIQIRETTYTPPEIPERRCGACRFAWSVPWSQRGEDVSCHAIEIRGDIQRKLVHRLGICDLYEPKEASDGK